MLGGVSNSVAGSHVRAQEGCRGPIDACRWSAGRPEIDLGENVWLGVGARLLKFQVASPRLDIQPTQDEVEDPAQIDQH
ncbi:MAG: hypothetical protein CM1200mP39_19420 [Dehalococcoidia bacterium]|nr:MAG: hypothetical protein CM1200mP39_19420 [Dehalococcoidia bacterium]